MNLMFITIKEHFILILIYRPLNFRPDVLGSTTFFLGWQPRQLAQINLKHLTRLSASDDFIELIRRGPSRLVSVVV
jgi:hypothetical protein